MSAVPVIAVCWVVALVPTVPLWFGQHDDGCGGGGGDIGGADGDDGGGDGGIVPPWCDFVCDLCGLSMTKSPLMMIKNCNFSI